MTQDEMIPLPPYLNASYEGDDLYSGNQVRELMKLVAAKEREECANLCWKKEDDNAFVNAYNGKRLDLLCSELIRAKG